MTDTQRAGNGLKVLAAPFALHTKKIPNPVARRAERGRVELVLF
jgi:hypothetical protein